MFAEEEWTDNLPDKEQTHSIVKAKPCMKKHKAISRNCLKRTLETLGSAPDWDCIQPSVGSDEEPEGGPIHLLKKKRKKKRSKKHKKTSGTGMDGDMDKEEDILQKPVKKRQVKRNVDTANIESSKKLYNAEEASTVKKLSRQQWKNKMKNKRQRKNKFLLNSPGVADVKMKEKLRQVQDLSIAGKMQNDDLSLCTMASVEKNYNVPLRTGRPQKAQSVTKNVNKYTPQLTSITPVQNGLKTSAHNQCEKQRPVNMDKKSLLQANKLRSISNIHATETKEKLSDINLEQEKDFRKVDECQMDRSSALRSRMEKRLQSARFRYINELLYTSTSGEAKRIFTQDPDAFRIYHTGYTEQVKHWPANPVDSIISYIRHRSPSLVIADFGCGDCKIAQSVKNKVHCFDLVPICDLVTTCDMANGKSFIKDALKCMAHGLRHKFSCVNRKCVSVKEMVFQLQRECYHKHNLCSVVRKNIKVLMEMIHFQDLFPKGPHVELVNILLGCGEGVRVAITRRIHAQCEQNWGALCASLSPCLPGHSKIQTVPTLSPVPAMSSANFLPPAGPPLPQPDGQQV